MSLAAALGLLAGVAGVVNTIPYLRDTLRGSTRPHSGTWLIWAVLGIVVCLSQRADGASWSLVMAGTEAVLTAAVFLLAFRLGDRRSTTSQAVTIAIAAGGVGGWILVDEPVVATACVIAADLLAATMMIPKTYRDPGSETLASFAVASLGGALAAGAVGSSDVSLLCYPVYFCVVNAAIAVLIGSRRMVLQKGPAWSAGPF